MNKIEWIDPKWVKNRSDKSILYLVSFEPEKILNENIIEFKDINYIHINLDYENTLYDFYYDNFKENFPLLKYYKFLKNISSRKTYKWLIKMLEKLSNLKYIEIYLSPNVFIPELYKFNHIKIIVINST